MRHIPDWSIQTSWWASGIFATGGVSYFLSTHEYGLALAAGIAAILFAALAIVLHRKKDAQPISDVTHDSARETTPLIAEANNTKDSSHHTPHQWIRTNHSNADIVWVPTEGTGRRQVERIASEYQSIQPSTQIERAAHTETSDVYRIADPDNLEKAICLKVFRRFQEVNHLSRLCAVQREIAASGIFNGFSKYLVPLLTKTGAEWVQPKDEADQQAIAFRFLNEAKTETAKHFKGLSLQEVESVATQLGRVNDILLIGSLGGLYPDHFAWNPKKWDKTIAMVRGEDTPSTETIALARTHLQLIGRTRRLANELGGNRVNAVSLNDLHPHNVFVIDRRCILIIDYEAVRSDWPEVATCAFALHRFCREYVRVLHSSRKGDIDVEATIATAANAFLKGYAVARPDVIHSVQKTGVRWAKALNFAKLMNVIEFSSKPENDPSKRNQTQYFQEAVKFISYLLELDVFERAICKMPMQ